MIKSNKSYRVGSKSKSFSMLNYITNIHHGCHVKLIQDRYVHSRELNVGTRHDSLAIFAAF
jgi:hypothetical protein